MARKDAPHYRAKHGAGETPAPALAEAVKKAAPEGRLSCRAAFEVAGSLRTNPSEVGKAADLLEVRLVECQLGLFGHGKGDKGKPLRPASSVSGQLEQAIRAALREGRLPCAEAWRIAADLRIKKIDVAEAAEAMGVKIGPCQLGAF